MRLEPVMSNKQPNQILTPILQYVEMRIDRDRQISYKCRQKDRREPL
jgi:hypothetical protein